VPVAPQPLLPTPKQQQQEGPKEQEQQQTPKQQRQRRDVTKAQGERPVQLAQDRQGPRARARHRHLRPHHRHLAMHHQRLPPQGGLPVALPCLPSCAPSRLLGSRFKREMLNHTPVVIETVFAPSVVHSSGKERRHAPACVALGASVVQP
jgi:hypothetical protein